MNDVQRASLMVGLTVGILQSSCHPTQDEGGDGHRNRSIQLLMTVQEEPQVETIDELHGDKQRLPRVIQLIDLNNVGMNQVGHQLGLAHEHLGEGLVGTEFGVDGLDGHRLHKTAGTGLLGLIDRAHPAGGDLSHDAILIVPCYKLVFHGENDSSKHLFSLQSSEAQTQG